MVDYAQVEVNTGSGVMTLLSLTKMVMGHCDPFDTTKDDMISLYIQTAAEAAETYTQNALALQPVTQTQPYSSEEVCLTYWPYSDGLKVDIDGEDKTEDYTVFRRDKLAYAVSEGCYPTESACYAQMDMAYNAGYDPLPAELGLVIARTATGYIEQSAGGGQIKKQVIDGVGSVEYAVSSEQPEAFAGLGAAVLGVLDFYKAVKLGV